MFQSSIRTMSTRELILFMQKSFILGFALGGIGFACLIFVGLGKLDNPLVVGTAAILPLLIALLVNMMYRHVLSELSSRLGE